MNERTETPKAEDESEALADVDATVSGRLFAAFECQCTIESDIYNQIYAALGGNCDAARRDEEPWLFEDVVFDHYDRSLEMENCHPDLQLNEAAIKLIMEWGFDRVWLNRNDDTELYYHLVRMENGNRVRLTSEEVLTSGSVSNNRPRNRDWYTHQKDRKRAEAAEARVHVLETEICHCWEGQNFMGEALDAYKQLCEPPEDRPGRRLRHALRYVDEWSTEHAQRVIPELPDDAWDRPLPMREARP